jgi:hypothetical protein
MNVWIVLGSISPDIPVFFFSFWYMWIVPKPQLMIWGSLYFREDWQIVFDLSHSIPIFLVLTGLAYYFSMPRLFTFSIASLLHAPPDFFLHREDAHAHFFPLSSYKFISPISYWDSRYFGHYFYIFEALVVLALSFPVFRYLKTWWGKILLILANFTLLGGPIFWFLMFSLFR